MKKIKTQKKKITKKSKLLPIRKVKEGIETDFTGLPMNSFDPNSWE